MATVNLDTLYFIMVGITARCNAMCPGCPRNIDGSEVNYDVLGPANNWDMPLDLFKKCFTCISRIYDYYSPVCEYK